VASSLQCGEPLALLSVMEHTDEPTPRTAGEVMTAHPTCCTPDTPLTRVAQLMVLQDCGEIPVVENEDTRVPIGVVTDRDIVCRLIAKGISPLDRTAESCMSQPAITVDEEASLADVLAVMEKHQIRRVPVVNPRGACVGMIAQADLAWTGSGKQVAELVREISRDSDDPSR
jgi:CBS domain-containing protein